MDVSAFQAGATDDLNLQQIMADRLRSLPKPIRTTVGALADIDTSPFFKC